MQSLYTLVIIRFQGDHLVNCGVIKYFFIVNGGIFVALNELIIKNNITERPKVRTSNILKELKKKGILNLYFFLG